MGKVNEQRVRSKINREWYDENKDERNAKRRAKYKSDKATRDKAKANAAANRAAGGPQNTDEVLQRVNPVTGKLINVYRITAVADKVGRTAQVIRQWEGKGYVPEPSFDGVQRVYTHRQINLIKRIVKVFDKFRYRHRELQEHLDPVVETVFAEWEQ